MSVLLTAGWLWMLGPGCIPEPPDPDPAPDPAPKIKPHPAAPVRAPDPEGLSMPMRKATSPAATPGDPALEQARTVLMAVVDRHAGNPNNPWAIGHGLLAKGPEMKTWEEKLAIPFLFERYAKRVRVGDTTLVHFPAKEGSIRIEPHADLVLKVLMELGTPLESRYLVEGEPATLEDLYRHSLYEAWVEDDAVGFASDNDTPWALQALATPAPDELKWTADGYRPMNMDAFTDYVVADLHEQTAFMRDAMAKGETVQKRKQGIFSYTCGGQHLLQGAAYAVARGFGSDASRTYVEEEVDVLFWRMGVELPLYDKLIEENPTFAGLLLEQRLKFLGHFLESTHKMAALGLFEPDETQKGQMLKAREELVKTVATLLKLGTFAQLDEWGAGEDPAKYQTYLDFVGDSAHAIRGIDLSTGKGSIAY